MNYYIFLFTGFRPSKSCSLIATRFNLWLLGNSAIVFGDFFAFFAKKMTNTQPPHSFFFHNFATIMQMKKATLRQYSESIKNVVFTSLNAERMVYENCELSNCSFSNATDFDFINCRFVNCNLSNVNFKFCGLQDVLFTECKLMGADFATTKDFLFAVHFDNCNMDYASFDRKKMGLSSFKNCKAHGANFTQTDFSKSSFLNCDFHEAVFVGTNLSGIDFTTCKNFLIDPESNVLKNAKFSKFDLSGLLYRHDIIIVD